MPSDPVYVGGLDRSGKTTMSAYVGSHSRIAIPTVGSNMWTYFFGQYGDLADPDSLDRCLEAMMSYKHVRTLDPDPDRIRKEFGQGPATYARLFSLFLIHFAERAGKPRWGAQTGLIERYADRLFDAYDGLRVIHMIRDPRDRYWASLERWPNGRGRSGGATARWQYSTRLAERHQERYPGRYLIVRFEDLVEHTETTLRDVCGFLGEDFEPGMLEMTSAPKHRRRLIDGDQPDDLAPLLSDAYIGRFRGNVPGTELAFMQLHAGRRMRSYGYAPSPLALSPRDRARFGLVEWPSQLARMAAWRTVEELQQRFPGQVGRKPGRRMIVEPS
jgi:hypothetical protein